MHRQHVLSLISTCGYIHGSINQSINKFISRHGTEARATVRLCRIKEKCLEMDLKCVNGWSSSTVQWKRVPKSRNSNWEMTSSSVQVVRRDWQKLLCGWSQQARLTVWADQISEVAWLLERSMYVCMYVCPKIYTQRAFKLISDVLRPQTNKWVFRARLKRSVEKSAERM